MLGATPVAAAKVAPAYGRIGLPMDGARVLAVKLLASGSTGLRDVLYVDLNFNGKFEANEKCTPASRSGKGSSSYRYCVFPQLRIPAGHSAGATACQLSLFSMYQTAPHRKPVSETMLSLQCGDVERSARAAAVASGSGPLATAGSLKSAPLSGVSENLALKVEAKPDPQNKGHTGFGATLGWPKLTMYFSENAAPNARLVVKDGAGNVVHEKATKLDQLGFG